MLDGLFRPRSVAIIGASANPLSIGHIVLRNLTDYGFQGPIFPINPKTAQIRSFRCYKSVLDVPDEIDLVNISIAAKLLPAVIEECGKKGVKFAIVHSAGFKEMGPEGVKREQDLVKMANGFGIRIFGPNSQGVQNSAPEVSVYANFTFVPMKPGNISIVAQSGGVGEMLKLHLHNVGLGHRMYASYGNESDLTMPEILEYYGKDEGTRAIMVQIESFKNPARFLEVASAITPKKPILAIKAGQTREGSVAVCSHTGSLVDQGVMATAMFRKAGVLEFRDTDEMIKTAIAMSSQEPPPGRRLGLVTNTGGPGVQAVDEAITRGLKLAVWSDEGKAKLRAGLHPEASVGNPVDVVATGGPEHYKLAIETLLAEKDTDMVLVFFVTAPFVDLDSIAARIKEALATSKKPVVAVIETSEKWYSLIKNLRAGGVPVYEFSEDGARALAAMAKYSDIRARKVEPPPELKVDKAKAQAIVKRFEGKGAYLPQIDAFELLSAYGVPVPKLAVIASDGDVAAAAKKVGFPCVLKIDSTEVVHKSDAGGVTLNIKDEAALAAAYKSMRDKFAGKKAAYVAMEQKPVGREVIIGLTEAPGLGSLVMFGLGGIFVEVMKDVIFGVSPLSRPEAGEMMRGIKGFPMLEGIRGEKGVDLPAMEDLLCRVSRLAADFPSISEMDLNPIFAYPAGTAPAAVDVRIKVR
ncbi:MAG: acetate--CoA ligase family protein [Deltaproteobacteria bacterium]|nr:acetate--CoA ligase family protein [Deltaproteobacteria bacterium]